MDSGYLWSVAEEEACERLSLLIPEVNRWWKVMPMGDLNSASTYVAMMKKLQMEWYTLSKERGLKILHKRLLLLMCYCMVA